MAFSTQKEFFNVPFMNENIEDECARACVKLKSYASTIDDRSWALDETNRSRFLSDLVTCKTPVTWRGHDGDWDNRDSGSGEPGNRKLRDLSRGPGDARAQPRPSDINRVKPGDSLIDATHVTLDKLQGLLQEKKNLQNKLNTSEESLRTAKAEYAKVRDILHKKYDRNEFKDFYNRMQQLASSGKFTKNDENDFKEFFKRIEDLGKAYEVSQAENNYLKRLLEKLQRRVEMDKIPMEEEKSSDIPYLQDQVNKLRKELMALRKAEDEKMYGKGGGDPNLDAATIRDIVKDRNSLRNRLKAMNDIQAQVGALRRDLGEANQVTNNLSNNLNNNSKHMNNLEKDMRDMQTHYEKIEKDRCNTMECMQRKIDEMQRALCQAKLEAQKIPCMQQCIRRLEESLKQRDRTLGEYDAQFRQLMYVIDELRYLKNYSKPIIKLESYTQTVSFEEELFLEDLWFYTSATLNEIIKEIENRGGLTMSIADSGICLNHIDDDKFDLNINKYNVCCKEVQHLREIIKRLQNEKSSLSLTIQSLQGEEEKTRIVKRITAEDSEIELI